MTFAEVFMNNRILLRIRTGINSITGLSGEQRRPYTLCGNTEEKTSKYKLTHILGYRHGTGMVILASTVTSRAQACQITVTGGLPLHLVISSSRKHLIFLLWPLFSSTRLNYYLFT
jgi:hypothetical protein